MNTRVYWSLPVSVFLISFLANSGHAAEHVFRGELKDGDKTHKQTDGFVDYHVVRANAGELMTITMQARDDSPMDTYLFAVGPSGQEFSNDDTDEGGSRVTFRVPETGEWEIAASAYEDETGAYTVTVTTQKLKLMLGERGELQEGDEVLLKEGELYDKFMLEVEADKTYVVMASSSDFDTFLAVHYPGGFAKNSYADGSSSMSLVVFRPEKSGPTTLVVTSSYGRVEGRYRLAAYEATAAPPVTAP